MSHNDRYEYSNEEKAEGKHNRALDSEIVYRERSRRPSYLNDLDEKPKQWGLVMTISALWIGIEQLVPGRANRIALGRKFHELQRIYSEKNIGGNRRTSGHGTFEKECEHRGYSPRTVRAWIADYKAGLSGAPTEAQKRSTRQHLKAEAVRIDLWEAGREIRKSDPPTKERGHFPAKKAVEFTVEQKALIAALNRPSPGDPHNKFHTTLDSVFRSVSWLLDEPIVAAIPSYVEQDAAAFDHAEGSLIEIRRRIEETLAHVREARSRVGATPQIAEGDSQDTPTPKEWTTPAIAITSTTVN
jgi:hypothetical protein